MGQRGVTNRGVTNHGVTNRGIMNRERMYMNLRLATTDEFDKVRSFYWNLIEQMRDQADSIGWKKGIYPTDDYLRESIRAGQLYVLDGPKGLLASVILNSSRNEGYEGAPWSIDCAPEEVLVPHALAVDPACQGAGIGKNVVSDMIELAQAAGKKAMRLDILGGNTAAERLYTSMGFQYVQAKEMFYEDTGWTEYVLYELGPLGNTGGCERTSSAGDSRSEIRSGEITLRRCRLSDAQLLYEELGKDPAMRKYTGWNPYATPESAKAAVREIVDSLEQSSDDCHERSSDSGDGYEQSRDGGHERSCDSDDGYKQSCDDGHGKICGDGYEQGCSGSGKDCSWVIEWQGVPAGIIGGYDYSEEDNSIEIGYSIFHKYWHHGLAAKAVAVVSEYLLRECGISILKAWSAVDNVGSVKALCKNGFVQTEICESGIHTDDGDYDQAFFERRA